MSRVAGARLERSLRARDLNGAMKRRTMRRSARVLLIAPLGAVLMGATSCPASIGQPGAAPAAGSGPVVIYVQDSTGAAWPVTTAVRLWDAGLRTVQLRYGHCLAGSRCAHVRTGRLPTDIAGQTDVSTLDITLSTANTPADLRLTTTLHELGHVLIGPEHSNDPTSVMFPDAGTGTRKPSVADYAAANAHGGDQ